MEREVLSCETEVLSSGTLFHRLGPCDFHREQGFFFKSFLERLNSTFGLSFIANFLLTMNGPREGITCSRGIPKKRKNLTQLKFENMSRKTRFPISLIKRLYLMRLFSSSYPEGNCCVSLGFCPSLTEFTTCSNHSQDNGRRQVRMCPCVRIEKHGKPKDKP